MHDEEIRKVAELEATHWWYRARRAVLTRQLAALTPDGGPAIDVGSCAGGHLPLLHRHGWSPLAVEYSDLGVRLIREQGWPVIRGDIRRLPFAGGTVSLAVAMDVLEHIDDDRLALRELFRVLRPGGTLLMSVPQDMRLWSAHDVALSHFRRYERAELRELLEAAGFAVERLWSWNVLLRPVAALRRRRGSNGGTDMERMPWLVNTGLRVIAGAERLLPVGRLPGLSLMLRAQRPPTASVATPAAQWSRQRTYTGR
ncbi:class I SAM-dependent methyltransferase [Dactylosporangium sp. CS-033363]|uniref:class I SAM-dependent methyltransferase n=1 Tax=Dactylosporangium sp. CS-033363 TaxID=3239935 RepID=UPI003D9175B5